METPLVPPATSALRLHWFNIAQAGIEPDTHHIDVPFHQAHPPYQPALLALLSVPPQPEPDGHLYWVDERLKLAGFVNAQIACTEL